jgi:hypothetical protein
MPGPAKLPPHLKVIRGTFAEGRDVDAPASALPVLDKLPSPPIWLRRIPHGLREWKRIGPILIANRLLSEGSLSTFATLCALHGRNIEKFQRGDTPSGAHLSQYRALAASFGLLAMNLSTPTPSNPFAPHDPSHRKP